MSESNQETRALVTVIEALAPPAGHTILDEETGYTVAPCNDCGRLTFVENLLCGPCYQEQLDKEEWEMLHPEFRCPPRE